MSSQQVGELYYKVGVKGLQEALKDLDKLYEKSGKGPSSSSPFNLGPVDKSGATIKSVAEARKHLQELAQGIGVDLNKVVSQIGKMPELMLRQAKARNIAPSAAYDTSSRAVFVNAGVATPQSLKHELMHAIQGMVPKDLYNSIVTGFAPARLREISGTGSNAYKLDRMRPEEVFASFMERQSLDVIRALIGSDMTTKVAALAGDAAARAVLRAATVNRTAPVTLAGGFGEGVSVDSRYGRGSRVVSATTTLPASSLSRQGRPDPNDFGATVNAPSSGDDFGAGVLTPAQKAKATAAANAANARASQVQANIAAFMGSNHGGFAGGGGFGGGGGPGGGVPPNVPPANPWLPTISTMTRDEHNNLVARAASATSLANEITGQIRGNGRGGINERLDNARMNVLQEEAVPGSTGSTITARENELLNLEEQRLHVAGRHADIEQAVNNTLGTQVSYANKIAEAEEAALKYAKQRNELPLSAAQEAAIKKGARSAEEANLIGGVGGSAQKNLEDAKTRLKNLQDARAGATAENAPLIDKAIRETRALIDLEARRLRIAQELAVIENRLATDSSLRPGSRKQLEKAAAHYREELKAANAQSENSARHNAKDRSKLSNYRLQELSYGAQDFAQVLSGGGGLDAALRAANNNISQFFAAAGGPNAARYSLMATGAILGIAGALKMMSDVADAPNKKLEELIARMKELQAASKEIRTAGKGSLIGFGEIGGAGAAGGRIVDLEAELRDAKANRNSAAELFTGRSQDTYGKMFADWGRGIASLPLGSFMNTAAGNEMWSMGDARAIERAFFERFSQGKDAGQITKTAFSMTPHDQRQMDVILKSKGVSPEDAAEAFAAIKDMGGWSNKTAEELKAMTDEINRVRDIHKKMEYAADSYRLALEETAANLRRRNELLAGAGGQTQLSARAQDFAFANQQNAMARQFDKMAKMARDRGDTDIAKSHEESARKARGEADMRMRGIAPGDGAFLTGAAASLEGVLSPFNQQIQDAQQAQRDAAYNKSAGREKRAGADLLGAKQEVAIADEIKRKEVEAAKQRVDDARARVAATDNLNGYLRGTHDTALKELEAAKDEHKRVSETENPNQRKARVRAERARQLVAEGMDQEAAGRRADWEAKEQEKKAREGRNFAMRGAMEDLSFGGPRANQNYAEAQREFVDSLAQMRAQIVAKHEEDIKAANGDAKLIAEADQARADAEKKLDEAKARKRREDKAARDRYAAQLKYEAAATTQNELEYSLKAIEERRIKEIEKAKKEFADPSQAIVDINNRADKEVRAAKAAKERKDRDINNMFSDQAASLVGGRRQQEYENVRKLEENMKRIEEGVNSGELNQQQADEAKRRAKLIYDETDKQINRKGLSFSDIGSSWKTIQMSLKPEKSIELQKMMNDHMAAIAGAVADKQGLLIRLPVGP